MKALFLLLLPCWLYAQNKASTQAAIEFVNSLSNTQKAQTLFPFNEMSRYEWHYLPAAMSPRTGLAIKDMDSAQKIKAHQLLKSFLSEKGYVKSETIMSNEYLLKQMEPGNGSIRIPENYYIAVYGNPADTVWGWKISGHHLTLNYTMVNGQLAFAPFFFGIYPAEVKEGENKGRRVLKEEEDLGFQLVNSLNDAQKQQCIFQLKAFEEIVTTNAKNVKPLDAVGIYAKDLHTEQKIILNKLIVAYLSSMPDDIARKRMQRITTEDMDAIQFGWAGGLVAGEPHYYRVQGKTFLIEFDNTQANANHIHTVWRDFHGDFGEDLLWEHYHNVKHHDH